MDQEPMPHAEEWAVKTFGAAELGDPRRTDRLIKVASALAAHPSASLPHALETWGETQGRGPVGNSKENIGFGLHTVLAMNPQTQHIRGCMTLEPFIRKLAPALETKAQRKKRERESQVWERSVHQIGRVPEMHQWIYVGDSGSDVYTFWQTCEELGYDFVLRVAQDRDVELPQGDALRGTR